MNEILKAVKEIDALEIGSFCACFPWTCHCYTWKETSLMTITSVWCASIRGEDILRCAPGYCPCVFATFSKLQFTCAAVHLSAIVAHCLLICLVTRLGDTHTHCCFTGDEVAGVALPSSSVLLFLSLLVLRYDSRKTELKLSIPFGEVNIFFKNQTKCHSRSGPRSVFKCGGTFNFVFQRFLTTYMWIRIFLGTVSCWFKCN